MHSFAEHRREARRLAVLKVLAQMPAYEAGQHLIYQALPAEGVPSSADEVAADLDWLAEVGLVSVQRIDAVRLARITQRGLDVAAGRAHATGVARPMPGA